MNHKNYTLCPNCNSMNAVIDLRDGVYNCHDCHFWHWYEDETTEDALKRHRESSKLQRKLGEIKRGQGE